MLLQPGGRETHDRAWVVSFSEIHCPWSPRAPNTVGKTAHRMMADCAWEFCYHHTRIQPPNPRHSLMLSRGKSQRVARLSQPWGIPECLSPVPTLLYLGPLLTSCRANRAWACQEKSTPRVNLTHISLACEGGGRRAREKGSGEE